MAGLLHASRWGEATSANGDGGSDSFEAEVLFEKAATLLDRGLYAESEGYFREVLSLLPDHASALNNLGTAIWRQARVHEAEEYYRRALIHDPNDYAILNNLGNVLWEQGRLDEAVQWFRPAVALRPNCARRFDESGSDTIRSGGFRRGVGLYPRVAPPPAGLT